MPARLLFLNHFILILCVRISCGYLDELVGLKGHDALNKQLAVLNVLLQRGDVDVTEWHVVL